MACLKVVCQFGPGTSPERYQNPLGPSSVFLSLPSSILVAIPPPARSFQNFQRKRHSRHDEARYLPLARYGHVLRHRPRRLNRPSEQQKDKLRPLRQRCRGLGEARLQHMERRLSRKQRLLPSIHRHRRLHV